MWTIELFGSLRAVRGEREITRFRSRQTADLLAYLGYYRDQRHHRDTLVEMFWPETGRAAGRVSLNTSLSALRRELEPESEQAGLLLVSDRRSVGLNPAQVRTDVSLFEAGVSAAASLSQRDEKVRKLADTLQLYRGELLSGHFEPWILPESRRLESLFQQTTDDLVRLLMEMGDLTSAFRHAQRAISLDPLREDAHERLIRVLIAQSRPAAALQQCQDLERLLRQELDAAPGPRIRYLEEEIRAGLDYLAVSGRPAPAPSPGAAQTGGERRTGPDLKPSGAGVSLLDLESPSGAVPLSSRYYVERAVDHQLDEAIRRRESIVLLKGARQTGKTSLLARGLERARSLGARVISTDLRSLNESQLASPDEFLAALSFWIAEQLGRDDLPDTVAFARYGPNLVFQRFLRKVLRESETPVVWGMDEADRLFDRPWGCEVFALFRALYNERALDPEAATWKLTQVIAYSTEAHLFIADASLSPFNVGTQLTLEDFGARDLEDLNMRYGLPLRTPRELHSMYQLFGGQPYLVRRALHEVASGTREFASLSAEALAGGERVFGEHLRGILQSLSREPCLRDRIGALLAGTARPTESEFHRLRSAGLMLGTTAADARTRCALYEHYLRGRLAGEDEPASA